MSRQLLPKVELTITSELASVEPVNHLFDPTGNVRQQMIGTNVFPIIFDSVLRARSTDMSKPEFACYPSDRRSSPTAIQPYVVEFSNIREMVRVLTNGSVGSIHLVEGTITFYSSSWQYSLWFPHPNGLNWLEARLKVEKDEHADSDYVAVVFSIHTLHCNHHFDVASSIHNHFDFCLAGAITSKLINPLTETIIKPFTQPTSGGKMLSELSTEWKFPA